MSKQTGAISRNLSLTKGKGDKSKNVSIEGNLSLNVKLKDTSKKGKIKMGAKKNKK